MNIPETAVETIAKFMSQEAMDWVDVETDDHDHDLECTNWRAYKDDARTALQAALPSIRKQIGGELREMAEKWSKKAESERERSITVRAESPRKADLAMKHALEIRAEAAGLWTAVHVVEGATK